MSEHADHSHDEHGHDDHGPVPEPDLKMAGWAASLVAIVGFILAKTVFHDDHGLLGFVFNPIGMIGLFVVGMLTLSSKCCCCAADSASSH